MKLSISNIAWLKDEDKEVYPLMKHYGFTGLDIAPARIFENPFDITCEDAKGFKQTMETLGLEMGGMQSLLYGSEGLALFEGEEKRIATKNHLFKMMDYASKIGIKALVFGSPKNRVFENMKDEEVEQIARSFFAEIGEYAKGLKLHFCIEPNPKEYGTNFLTNTLDAGNFVRRVGSEGIGLNVDLGTMILNNEDITQTMKDVMDVTRHLHISVPFLASIIQYEDKHRELSRIVETLGYEGYGAIEMKNSITTPNTLAVEQALKFVSKLYGGI